MTASTAQIAAQLDAVLAREPHATAVAVRSATRQDWPGHIARRGRSFVVRWCESALALREALTEGEVDAGTQAGLLLMTPLSDHEVPDDVAARLARARVFQPRGWDIVRQMFDAQGTDARLGRYDWMPQQLIELSDQGLYPPVASGFLDLETAWREVLRRALGIDAARPDATALLKWSQQPDADLRLARLPAQARTDLSAWLSEGAGVAGELTMRCVDAGRTADALPLALACDVIFSKHGEGESALGRAAVRLERFVADHHVSVTDGRTWAEQAARLLERESSSDVRGALERADALLRDLRIAEFADLSDQLPHGLELRLQAFATAVVQLAEAPTPAHLALVEELANSALRHRLSGAQPLRAERVEMARRIGRWLVAAGAAPMSTDAMLTWQADQGAFVDWARFRLLGGDELPELSEAFARLRAEVTRRRNALSRSFAGALARSNREALPHDGRVVPVERVLDRVLAPLAGTHPVLFLVMDGLSVSIFRELFEQPEKFGWNELVPESIGRSLVGMAALPTTTEVSRTSLLSGRLALGAAAQEKSAFSTFPALLQHSAQAAPPRLFHKGELADDGNLAADVRAALSNRQQKVVGIVFNAVDDHLSGPDQLHQRWGLEDLRLLLPLLREARDARRVLVVTADHGHLLEDGTQVLAGGDHDRWRTASGPAVDGELALSGGRVLTTDGAHAAVCLFSESLRYTGRKNGYHGGVSLQEVAVPLSVFAPFAINVAGWRPAPPPQPEWWELPNVSPAAAVASAPVVRAPARKAAARQAALGGLFAPEELPVPPLAGAGTPAPDWVTALISSQIYASQRQLAARVALADDTMRKLLEALHDRGGKLTRSALAQRLGVPEMRLAGLLSAARRVLNVDQAAVLSVDEGAGSVALNRTLLVQQFRLTLAEGGR